MNNLPDRSVPAPLYHQVKQALLREISDRGLVAGDRLPTEAEIEERYRVSRSPIRQALNELVVEGVIERVQGRGTFVAQKTIVHVPQLTSFTENMRAQGFVPTRRVVKMERRRPDTDVAARLGAPQDAECHYLLRTLLADGEPVGVSETWLPEDLLGEVELDVAVLEAGSLYDFLQRPPIELELHHGAETIRARKADPQVAGLLGISSDDPVLVVDRLTRSGDDHVVESTRMVFAADRYEYAVEVDRPAG
jgi:GntR family transcriptional regulator